MSLYEIIIERINRTGPISFHDFMQTALYHPDSGYYTSRKNIIGKSGDFYTSSNVGTVFGEMLARQMEEMWRLIGGNKFTVVEMGAGTGMLSRDVLEYLKNNRELSGQLDYVIIEKSPVLKEEQKLQLADHKIRWCGSIRELSGITGCIFSNELVDAFPVHVIVMEEGLKEIFVDYRDGFIEVLKPASSELIEYLSESGIVLPAGYRTEINLDAINWIQEIGASLEKGYVITVDYGYPDSELYAEHRNLGTLMCYYRHTANEDPYQHIGEQDITSHVNFSALVKWGEKTGLELGGFTDQMHFLMGMGIEGYINNLHQNTSTESMKKILQVKTVMMGMGETFKILIQKKGVDSNVSGLKYPSRWNL